MAAITWAMVQAMDSDGVLPDLTPQAQLQILSYVNGCLTVSNYGGEGSAKLTLARIYLAAHFAQLGPDGAVTSESAGDLRRAYAVPRSGYEYEATSWGRAFINISKTTPARAGVVLNGRRSP
jgi:hypothetical protein